MLAALPPLASATVSSDRSHAKQLTQQITAQGASIQQLVGSYDKALAKEETVHAKLLTAEAQLVSDQGSENVAVGKMRQAALYEFVTGSSPDSIGDQLASGNLNSLLVQQEYARILGGNLQVDISTFKLKERQTQAAETSLKSEQATAQGTVTLLAKQGQAARVALLKEHNLLGKVKGNLRASLLAAAAKQRADAREAEEQALAAEQAAQTSPTPTAPQLVVNPLPGTYANPLRAIGGLSPERVDQGVDYSGFGPIYAVGNGVVLSTVNAGWPGGTFISYQLSDGPAQGLVVYAGEDIYPLVQPGQSVTANTVIGTMYEGPDGIETGWADPSGDGESMANDYHQFSGRNSTAFGASFSSFLQSIGAPGGVFQNGLATGSLPPGWPSF